MNSTRLDLIKYGSVVLIVRKGNKPFLILNKNEYNKVEGIWLLTGDKVSLSGGEATTPTDDSWIESLISGLENDKLEIDKRIKFIKSLTIKK